MARFDLLGPQAREAINYAPREINIRTVISDFKSRRDPSEWDDKIDGYPPIDLLDPAVDKRLAERIDEIVRRFCAKSIRELHMERRRRCSRKLGSI